MVHEALVRPLFDSDGRTTLGVTTALPRMEAAHKHGHAHMRTRLTTLVHIHGLEGTHAETRTQAIR
jgi:hypothetical protein